MIFIVILLVVLISYAFTAGLVSGKIPLRILDQPNQRSLHSVAVPRTGGVAVLISFFVGLIIALGLGYSVPGWASLLGTVLLVSGCSFADDLKGLSVLVRLCFHLLAVWLIAQSGLVLDDVGVTGMPIQLPKVIAVLFTVLFIIWSINFYNFMDGMDGFAAGMSIIGFGTFLIFGLMHNHQSFAYVNACLVAAVSGFLVFNFPPAKIFMGDLGSSVLGLCFAITSIWGVNDGVFSIWIPFIVFSPFIIDATYTLIKRATLRERFWEAHKTHFYQRLVEAGYGHKKVVLAEYCLMMCCAILAILLVRYAHVENVQLVGILLVVGLYTVIILLLNKKLSADSTST